MQLAADILQKQFQILEKRSAGTLGVSAYHLEKDMQIDFKSTQCFFMCSTYKLPIAIYLLHEVQEKRIDLHALIQVSSSDLRPGVLSTLNQLDYTANLSISLYNILRFMLQESCNTATDIILNLMGGPQKVMNYIEEVGIHGLRVDRYILEILSAWNGITSVWSQKNFSLEKYKKLEQAVPAVEVEKAHAKFKENIQDTTTPIAMTQLLVKLRRNELLNKEYTHLLLNIMQGCKRGPKRLRGLLPPDANVSHKTGSLPGYTCDVGIITLPYNQGNIAISVFIKESTNDLENNESVLAEIGRNIYDLFVFEKISQ